ncbi:DUF488 family protein [Tundrisphaera lichenicola]|uniref:DUF488 domain-containing protein n=1 Tax=Tundrisphaera lichenicola TaxID=2029860 RepID=UPI003EC0FEE6
METVTSLWRPSLQRSPCSVDAMNSIIYTIGHSTHSIEHFVRLLNQHNVTAICDVRSKPYSKFNSQYNRETLRTMLKRHGITYVFLGKELGARAEDDSCYENGKVRYDKLASTPLFQSGLNRVEKGCTKYSIALMCAERDPIECHRTILVSRHIEHIGFEVQHILADGRLESHHLAMNRLIHSLGMNSSDLFRPRIAIEADAYQVQGDRIAYTKDSSHQHFGRGEAG